MRNLYKWFVLKSPYEDNTLQKWFVVNSRAVNEGTSELGKEGHDQ